MFEWPVRVYWEDTDAGGIVFYANYLKYFERARTEWLRHLGLGQQALRDDTGGMFVVSRVALDYLAPARLDDELLVSATLEQASRASLRMAQIARKGEQVLCRAQILIAWVDAQSLRPTRIPGMVLDAMQTFSQASVQERVQ